MEPVVSKEAKVFYSMIALLECAKGAHEYLLASPHKLVHTDVKNEMKGMFRRYQFFMETVLKPLAPCNREVWKAEWQRDYGVYSSIFEMMADMNDEQRGLLEQFAIELKKGQVEMELKEIIRV